MLGDLARAHREVAALEQLAQIPHVDAVRGHTPGIDQDAHLARLDTRELHARHAVETFHRALEVALQSIVGVGKILVGGDAHLQDRLVAE